MKTPKNLLYPVLLILPLAMSPLRAAILDVAETGGDNEPTDTIVAQWTGVTYNRTIANEPTPGALGTAFTVGAFASGAPAYVDRNHVFLNNPAGISIPAYLLGQEYIMSGNDNRDNAGYVLDVTVDMPSRVYMLIDNRLSDGQGADPPTFGVGAMQWILDGAWLPSSTGNNRTADMGLPDELPIDEGADGSINQYFSVYYHDFDAGTFQLFQADNATRNMYSVVVVPTGGPPPVFLSASPVNISEGQVATLDWIFPNDATAASIDNGVGDVLPLSTDGVGSTTVTPSVTTTYTLTVESPAGGQTATATVTVRLLNSFTADDPLLGPGESATLSWSTRSDATVTISGIGVVPAGNSSLLVSPAETTTYTLTAQSGDEIGTASVTLYVLPPGDLYALLDIGATGGTPEAGALGGVQLGGGVAGTNATNLPPTALVSETGDAFTLTIDNVNPNGIATGNIDWRDRGNSSGQEWTALGEDHVKNNAGVVRVTLGGLPAGTYDILSFHFDPTLSQSEAIRILVTDADGTAVDTGVVGSAFAAPTVTSLANTTANMIRHTARFAVRSNGVDDVILTFDGTLATDTEVPLNGLRISLAGPPVLTRIVDVRYDAGAGSVTIEFTSRPGSFYAIFASNDLTSFFEELDDSIDGEEGTTEFTELGIDPSMVPQRFYRVEDR